MKVTQTKIKNFRSIKDIKFEFDESLNIFVGINGSGKTTVLDALIISLSWLINRIQRENGTGKHIAENDIRKHEPFSMIETSIGIENNIYNWKIVKTGKGKSSTDKSNYSGVSEVAGFYRNQPEANKKLPVIAYYPVNRIVKEIKPRVSSKDSFYTLDLYENAIGASTNFQSFFDWLRLQDDILNEKMASLSKWIMKNRKWISQNINKSLTLLKKSGIDQEKLNPLIDELKQDKSIYEEPKLLFHKISGLLGMIELKTEIDLDELRLSFNVMASLLDLQIDSIKNIPDYLIKKVFKQLIILFDKTNSNKNLINFIWETLLFSVLLNLWWLSDKGKTEIKALFNEYNPAKRKNQIEWEDIINSFLKDMKQIIRNDTNRQEVATRNKGRELQTVTDTIEKFIDGYSNIRITRIPYPQILVDKNDETFNMEQLSDGEKNLIVLVGDIARRLAIANPDSNDPLKGNGIILIDEIDLHLHPSWQRMIIPKLTELFPNCQFFITTHSPQVISHVRPEKIYLLSNIDNTLYSNQPEESYGMSIDRVVELIMDEDIRPDYVSEKLMKIFEYIERNKTGEAKKIITELKKYLKTDPEILRAEMLIRQKEG